MYIEQYVENVEQFLNIMCCKVNGSISHLNCFKDVDHPIFRES